MVDEATYQVHPMIGGAAAAPQVAPQEPVQEQPEVLQQETQESVQQESQETPQQMRFREMRERVKQVERERDDALRIAKEIHNLKQAQAQVPQEDDENIGIGSEDYVEGKHLKQLYKEVKRLKQEVNQYQQQNYSSTAEVRLKSEFPDFERVVTKENIEMLAQLYPPIAQTLRSSNDLYSTGYSAYTLIKQFNIDQSQQNNLEKIQKNLQKPRSIQSISPQIGDTPLAKANAFANGLTDDLKKQLIKEMEQSRKQR
jgi:hypothetical protein